MQKSHTLLARSIHWSFILLYLYGIFKQVNELDELEDSTLLLSEIVFATVFLVIVILRYSYMRRFRTFLGAREPVHIVHYYFARTDLSYMLIFLHIGAAIYSRIKGEGVWSSMVPILKEDKPSENEMVLKIASIEEKVYDKVGSFFARKSK